MDISAYEPEITVFTNSYIKQQGYRKAAIMSVCRVFWTTWLNSTLLVKIMINEKLTTTKRSLQALQ